MPQAARSGKPRPAHGAIFHAGEIRLHIARARAARLRATRRRREQAARTEIDYVRKVQFWAVIGRR